MTLTTGDRVMADKTVKDILRAMIERLPDDVTWEDVQYEVYFHQRVDAGLADALAGRVVSHEEARRQFGLDEP